MDHFPGDYGHGDAAAVESFITAAIIGARDSYRDPRWLFWADNWIAGRDRSYESASLAQRQARIAHLRELAEAGHGGAADTNWPGSSLETLSDETAAERAAWAASLALITAPMAPDLTGFFLRFEAWVKSKLAQWTEAHPLASVFPATSRWLALARGA